MGGNGSKEFKKLAKAGASEQRVLWGSTSSKNPTYPDVKYIEELITRQTVNTVPENTLLAFLDHGQAKEAMMAGSREARRLRAPDAGQTWPCDRPA